MNLIPEACFFSGHRLIEEREYPALEAALYEQVIAMIENGVKNFICGGALGFDTLAAKAILELKKEYDIKLIMYLPCENQHVEWEYSDILEYTRIVASADEVFYVTRGEKSPGVMRKRNKAMVEAADYGICYLKNDRSGTAQTIRMAGEKGIDVINLYDKIKAV